ncbi:MAG TPA: cupin domain-containing protein [Burkholderiales bacterium]|nr:cupin domain-containing protein [Burkholderiales bacterium]
MTKRRLAGLPADEFLSHYWRRRPLLARRALPQHAALVRRETLFELAEREDLESRMVLRGGGRWRVRHGPFSRRDLARLPRAGWTLLVQGVERALPEAWKLLQEFRFIPYWRLDDLMVSYAPAGGGVGPHFDSYDVFLLQGGGSRRWRVSQQRDLALRDGAPLKLLRRFRPEQEWVLHPGDLLYLPPRCAHDGVALEDCITYSIGFRVPCAQELGRRFLEYLQEHLRLAGSSADPRPAPARRPARLEEAMLRRAAALLGRIRWSGGDVVRFLGCYLTEPAPQVVFARPARPLSGRAFVARAQRAGLSLAPATRMLYRGGALFINGEQCTAGPAAARLLSALADRRSLAPRTRLDRESARRLYQWYRAGYIELADVK